MATKLYTPLTRPELVPRPRLVARLNAGLHRKLSLISAPAGFGKTTLLSAWVAQCERPVIWISLDEGDNDVALFWAYLITALQKVRSAIEPVVQTTFQSPSPPAIRSALTMLINQITEAPDPFALVLDDYHIISAPVIHDMLMFLLEHQPPQMHLVIATRADPPLSLARLRGQGQITELYHSDLRFTHPEAAAFLEEAMHIELSTEAIAALEQRTEGWIAGLQMAAVSMQRHGDIEKFIQAFTGSHRYIFDYLIEEVLQYQPENVRRFLLCTSILDRLTAPLCDTVLQPDTSSNAPSSLSGTAQPPQAANGAAEILNYLERHNLFIVPLDDERRWYRYHRLFGDLLHQYLQREMRELVPKLHQRASIWYQSRLTSAKPNAWYERHNMADRAIKHALQAKDYERITDLIAQIAWEMLTWGEATTLLRWLDSLPDPMLRSKPLLGVVYAWALALTGRLDSVEAYLQPLDLQAVKGEVAALRSYVAGQQDDAERALDLFHQASRYLPEENLFLRCILAINRSIAHLALGQPESASTALREAIKLSKVVGWDYLILLATTMLGQTHEMQGLLDRAFQAHEKALAQASRGSQRPAPFAGAAYLGMAEILYEWNDLDGARAHAAEGIRLSELGDIVDSSLGGHLILGQIYLASGELELAGDALRKAEHLVERYADAYALALIADLKVKLWIARSDTRRILQWVHAHSLDIEGANSYARESELLTLAYVLIVGGAQLEALQNGQIRNVLNLLARLLERAEPAGRIQHVIKALVLQALAYHVLGKAAQALASIERALTLAKPGGYVRTFIDKGPHLADILRQALTQGIMPNYVANLLAASGEEIAKSPSAMAAQNGDLVEPLTEREIEVLRLIVAGLSNQEIADQLYIAVSTVKSHVNHVYGKLAVENRTQAVIKVQELHLL